MVVNYTNYKCHGHDHDAYNSALVVETSPMTNSNPPTQPTNDT